VHTRCGKHRRPKENLAILRTAVQETLAGRGLTPRTRGLLQHVVESMLARRAVARVRASVPRCAPPRRVASIPGHHQLARVVVARLPTATRTPGSPMSTRSATRSSGEAATHAYRRVRSFREPIRRVVQRATAGTVAN
jgi:hypothetical protein